MKTMLIAATIAAGSGLHPALAQAPATQPLGGNPVSGVCLLSREAIFANAKVGVAASARLRELTQQADAEIAAQRKPIADEARALEAQRASLKASDFQQREQALATRLQPVQQKAQTRAQELELTRQQALAKIGEQAQPVIAAAYKAKGCGLLVNRDSVLGGNMANDITADVVKGLDARMTSISFDRATLPARQQTASTAR